MFISTENGISIKKSDIIGIFNMDTATVSSVTRDFLVQAEKERKIVYSTKRVPESFILSDNGLQENVYMSGFESETVVKRVKG